MTTSSREVAAALSLDEPADDDDLCDVLEADVQRKRALARGLRAGDKCQGQEAAPRSTSCSRHQSTVAPRRHGGTAALLATVAK